MEFSGDGGDDDLTEVGGVGGGLRGGGLRELGGGVFEDNGLEEVGGEVFSEFSQLGVRGFMEGYSAEHGGAYVVVRGQEAGVVGDALNAAAGEDGLKGIGHEELLGVNLRTIERCAMFRSEGVEEGGVPP